jgi:rod shape-determining protein MreD
MSRGQRDQGWGRGPRRGRGRAPGERSAARKAVIVAALPLALLVAVVAQLTVVNRLPLPGGNPPDLVLLLVTAVAVLAPPPTGALAGFAGGLALDVAPPQAHYAGEYALVFCLTGYAAGRAGAAARAGSGERSLATSLIVMAAATTAGEAGKAALGLLLSDPHVTGPAIRHVLPGAVLADLLLTPVTLWLVTLVAGRPQRERAAGPEHAPGRLAVVFRLASAGAAPHLRLAGSGPVHQGPSWARRQPKLRLSDARARSIVRTNGAGSNIAQPLLAGGRASKLHFATRGAASGRASMARRAKSPSRGWLRRDRPTRRAPARRKTPARGWLHRSRQPWRRRGRRFLALMGGRR